MTARVTKDTPDFFQKYFTFRTRVNHVGWDESSQTFEVQTTDLTTGRNSTNEFDLQGTVNVANDLSLATTNASGNVQIDNGLIDVKGNISASETGGASVQHSTATVRLTGTGAQTYATLGNGTFPTLEIDKTAGTVAAAGGTTALNVNRFVAFK